MPEHQDLSGKRRAFKAAGAILLLAALVRASMGGVSAQSATPAASLTAGAPLVTVSGHGETNVPPDIAQVTIGVDVTKATLQETQQEATTRANQIIDTVKDAGVAARDIQTINYNVSVLTDTGKNADRTEVKGFEIVNQVQVTVRDIAKLGELLDFINVMTYDFHTAGSKIAHFNSPLGSAGRIESRGVRQMLVGLA